MIALLRIDDRLIHGQVIVGWGLYYHLDEFVILDDDLESWESELFLGCLEDESQGKILSLAEGKNLWQSWIDDDKKRIILIKDISTLSKFLALNIEIEEINLGGLHYLEGKTQYLNCCYLYDSEKELLKGILNNYSVKYQPLPSDHKIDLKEII